LQHFTGTLDNWDPAVTDPLAADHEVILFEYAGVARSTGKVPTTLAGMAEHVFSFLDTLGIETRDVLGFSLGGAIAQQTVLDNSKVLRKMILAGTAPRALGNRY
jgi:pimeloyl-ACP methyl ester carboxylesterase